MIVSPQRTGLYWLASYPKSGNTWFRIFLSNLLNETNQPIDLNDIRTGAIASSREWIDETLGFDSAYLNHDELDCLRPHIYKHRYETAQQISYNKVHDAYTYLEEGRPLIPAEGCLGVIYFIRNPLDVAISLAHYGSYSIDQAILDLGNPAFTLCNTKFRQVDQLKQHLLSWSHHVKSWTQAPGLNILVLRYEDMKAHPQEIFTQAVRFLKLDQTSERIEYALAESHIDRLKAWESKFGFMEKPQQSKSFFRKGMAGDWKNTLTTTQIDRIMADHGEVMQQYGYVV